MSLVARRATVLTTVLVAACSSSPSPSASPAPQATPAASSSTVAAITAADLRTRLFVYAADSMMGRQAGTAYNTKATDYIASELRRIGVAPGGVNGTYFQTVPIIHIANSLTKPITIDGKSFFATKDFIPRSPRAFSGEQIIYGGVFGDPSAISPDDAAGKFVILSVPNGANGKPAWSGTRQPSSARYNRSVAIAIAGMDGMVESDWAPLMAEGADLLDDPSQPTDVTRFFPPFGFLYIRKAMAEAMLGGPLDGMKPGTMGKVVRGAMAYDTVKSVPGRNVIGVIPGSDPALRGQYVAVGAHNDHVGFNHAPVDHDSLKAFNIVALPSGADSVARQMTPERTAQFRRIVDSLRKGHPARLDSIFNGADDDGSGTVSVLEIAEAFQKGVKPKRSLIFVWHTGEELGLFGSQYFTDHPTISRDSIVAQLNMDMVGRGEATDVTGKTKGPPDPRTGGASEGDEIHGNPDYVQLVGSRRLSTELGDIVESVNTASSKPLRFDYAIDANGHPSSIYCRSDHYSYARYGIPITFFTTGGHADYHQVTDEPQYIQYDHMARVATLVHDIAMRVGNLDHRIVVDKPKPDPKGQCVQ